MKFISISSAISKDRPHTASKASVWISADPEMSYTTTCLLANSSRGNNYSSHIFSNNSKLLSQVVWTFPGQSRLWVASVSVAPQAPPCSHQWWPTHWSSTVGPGGGTSALVPGPPGQRGQLPAGGSLMPRFKCKFPGHRAPTAGPTTTLELLNGGGGDSTDDVSLQGAGAASKHATHLKLWHQHSPRTKIWGRYQQTNVTQKEIRSISNVWKCELLRCLLTEWWGRVCSLGSNCSWQSKIRSKIDPWGPVRPV